MPSVVLYFQVHQPYRLNLNFRKDRFIKETTLSNLEPLYFNEALNKKIMQRVAKKCYLPANKVWLEAIDEYKKSKRKVKIAFSITGTVLEQAERYQPDVLDSFKQLAETGCVEFLGETYYHSLSSLYSSTKIEFIEQVKMHTRLMKDLLGKKPTSFRNTELIMNDGIMEAVSKLGFKAIMGEGIEHVLPKGYTSNQVFSSEIAPSLKILLRNYKLSDDIAFRFGAGDWEEYPLYADKYASWVSATPGDCINIFMDYESLGEHLWAESGIFEFLEHLPKELFKYDNIDFMTPTEVINKYPVVDSISIDDHSTTSWADDRDVGAWLRNAFQRISFKDQSYLERPLKKLGNPELLKIWRMLTTSDHLYYISQADAGPGQVHSYFSHYNSPIDAFTNYNEVINDLLTRVSQLSTNSSKK